MKKFSVTIISFLFLLILSPISALATDVEGHNPGDFEGSNPVVIDVKLTNPFSGGDSLFALLRTVINEIVLPIGGVLAVLAFIYSGFLYVTAQGNETKLKTAHLALLYTSIGTAVLLGSWVLANLICATIGELGGPICPT